MGQLVRIFPNPASNQVRLSFDGVFEGSLQIFDSNGRLVRTMNKISLPANIVVKDLVDGVYFLKMTNEEMSFTKRVVVSR